MEIVDAVEFGRRFRALRKAKGLNQNEIAVECGVFQPAVSAWEKGSTMPDKSRWSQTAKAVGVSIPELFFQVPEAK